MQLVATAYAVVRFVINWLRPQTIWRPVNRIQIDSVPTLNDVTQSVQSARVEVGQSRNNLNQTLKGNQVEFIFDVDSSDEDQF